MAKLPKVVKIGIKRTHRMHQDLRSPACQYWTTIKKGKFLTPLSTFTIRSLSNLIGYILKLNQMDCSIPLVSENVAPVVDFDILVVELCLVNCLNTKDLVKINLTSD
jgi:hypothetical protein